MAAACSSAAVRTTVMDAAGTFGRGGGGGGGDRTAEDEALDCSRSLLAKCTGGTSCMEGGRWGNVRCGCFVSVWLRRRWT